ncbi:MAG: DUF2490 domain-containing protein [Spirosomataceae bacterium]
MKKLIGILLVLITHKSTGWAQSKDDFQTWYGASLKLDFKKGWAVTGQYRLRLTENSSYYKGSYLFGQVDKRLNKYLLATANYRLAMVDVGTYHRYAVGLEGRYQLKGLSFFLRPMVQYQQQNFAGDDEQTDTDTYFRPRFTVKYQLSRRFDAYVYAEPFYKLDKNPNLDWWQNSAGIKYEFSKGKKINLYYIWQPDYSHKTFRTNHIVGIDLEFTIKPK